MLEQRPADALAAVGAVDHDGLHLAGAVAHDQSDHAHHAGIGVLGHPHAGKIQPGQVLLEAGAVVRVGRRAVQGRVAARELRPQAAARAVVARPVRTHGYGAHTDMVTANSRGGAPKWKIGPWISGTFARTRSTSRHFSRTSGSVRLRCRAVMSARPRG